MAEISFSEGDAAEVLADLHASAEELHDGLTIGEATHQDTVLVARLHNDIVGYLAATTEPLGGLLIWEHVVVPGFRDRGIGRRLLLEAARRTPPSMPITIDPSGDFAIDDVSGYYRRLGFPSTSEDRFRISVRASEVVDAIGEQSEEDSTLETVLRRKPTKLVTIDPDARFGEALALLDDMNIGSVVASHDGSSVDGILSERDIVVAANRRGAALLEGTVRDYMTTNVTTAEASQAIADVMELATVKRLRHIPVTDGGKLVGVVSIGDLLVFRMREHDMRRDTLRYRDR